MPGMTQQIQMIGSQNQMRNAEKLARDWAVAHAGSYHDPARKELGGTLPFRIYERDNLTITLSKPSSPVIKHCQLISVRYQHPGIETPYVSYLMTYTPAESAHPGGYLVSVTDWPAALQADMLPWLDKAEAGIDGLDGLMLEIDSNRSDGGKSGANENESVSGIDDLFGRGDLTIVLTEDGQPESDFRELAAEYSDWAHVNTLSASERLTIGLELSMEQLYDWVRARIALFSRHPNADGHKLLMAESDYEPAATFLKQQRDRTINEIPNRNCLFLMELLESTTGMPAVSLAADADIMAEEIVESTTQPKEDPGEVDRPEHVALRQRVYVLEDQLNEATTTIDALREQLQQYESYYADEQTVPTGDGASDDIVRELDGNRVNTVLGGLADRERFPRLRFLTNCAKGVEDYGKPRPNGVEILAAMDAINRLAQAWYNTPSGGIGPWDNYFIHLTGWSHADGESEFTMSRYGEKRSFSDQEHGRLVTIERHLTYRGSSGGLQIFFDRDDITDTFIVGYIGEHLPYATARS